MMKDLSEFSKARRFSLAKSLIIVMAGVLSLSFSFAVHAQNWQLVWSDEFDSGIGPDWVFEIGNGSGGWGNNELEYYRQQNATVQNGMLVITARQESFGGFNYTSARMKTQGRRSFGYGRVEARMSAPQGQGLWPAFWMLGDNITSVGWPACGEIDIFEHVNNEGQMHGTIHWSDSGGGYAYYGGSHTTNVSNFHVYAIERDASGIRWFVDGVQFWEANTQNGINGTQEFHNNFFILLNLAVGGNWPGFNVDHNALPAQLLVDYVRFYQDGGTNPTPTPTPTTTPPPGTINTIIQAENFNSMSGVQTEATSDSGGGTNVGWIDTGDWMAYNSINIPTSGNYTVEYRVASLNGGGNLTLDLNGGATVLGSVPVPNTGGWQTWTTISHTVYINAGTHNFGIYATTGGWNINWFRIVSGSNPTPTPPPSFSVTRQAENYSAMSGVQVEATSDTGGGSNVGWIDAGDWMSYNNITFPVSGTYTVEYRVASLSGGGTVSLDLNGGSTVLGGRSIPSTGGWQTWTTVSHQVTIPAGTYSVGIYAPAGGWNLNWWRIRN
ncbi:Beta-glucanase [Thalassocella blandensis]|nr:Beta-glucanase [Thalassocella blandensis]